jgi:hypothetical protein
MRIPGLRFALIGRRIAQLFTCPQYAECVTAQRIMPDYDRDGYETAVWTFWGG